MKVKLTIKKEYEIKSILIEAKIRYWDDAIVNGVEDVNG